QPRVRASAREQRLPRLLEGLYRRLRHIGRLGPPGTLPTIIATLKLRRDEGRRSRCSGAALRPMSANPNGGDTELSRLPFIAPAFPSRRASARSRTNTRDQLSPVLRLLLAHA